MENKLNNPHDNFIKNILADRDFALGFLQTFLPEELQNLLEVEKFVYANTSFISKDLQEQITDMLFDIPVKGKDETCFLSVLVEHKSYQDAKLDFQLLSYLANAYNTQLKRKEKPKVVIPLVYYHGKGRWKPKDFTMNFSNTPSEFYKYLPRFEKLFIDLNTMNEQSISNLKNALMRSTLLLQYSRFNDKLLLGHIVEIFSMLDRENKGNFIEQFIVYIWSTSDMDVALLNKEIESSPSTIKNIIMTTYEKLIAKGEEAGIKKGEEAGIKKGEEAGIKKGKLEGKLEGKIEGKIEVILNGHRNGLDIAILANITGLTEEEVRKVIQDKFNL